MSDEQKNPTAEPPVHARDDAESAEQRAPEPTGNATEQAASPVVHLYGYGEPLPVELLYDEHGPQVYVTPRDGERREVSNVSRVQLTHEAGGLHPVLAFWTNQPGTHALKLSAAAVYDVVKLEARLAALALRASENQVTARWLATEAAQQAVQAVADLSGDSVELTRESVAAIVDRAAVTMAERQRAPSRMVGASVTRACMLAAEARILADDVAAIPSGSTERAAADMLCALADAVDVLCGEIGALVLAPDARPFTGVQPRTAERAGGDDV